MSHRTFVIKVKLIDLGRMADMVGCHIRQNGQLLPKIPLIRSANYHFGAGISKASCENASNS